MAASAAPSNWLKGNAHRYFYKSTFASVHSIPFTISFLNGIRLPPSEQFRREAFILRSLSWQKKTIVWHGFCCHREVHIAFGRSQCYTCLFSLQRNLMSNQDHLYMIAGIIIIIIIRIVILFLLCSASLPCFTHADVMHTPSATIEKLQIQRNQIKCIELNGIRIQRHHTT